MIELNKEKLDLESYSNGKLKKKFIAVRTIYWLLRALGILGFLVVGEITGSLPIAVWTLIGAEAVNFGVNILALYPVKNALANARKEEIKLMNQLALNGIEVDTENFSLKKIAVDDARKNATIEIKTVNEDGSSVENKEVFGRTGNRYTYYYGKTVDDKNFIVSDCENHHLDKVLLDDGRDGYAVVVNMDSKHAIFEEKDLVGLPVELSNQLSNCLNGCSDINPKKRVRRK